MSLLPHSKGLPGNAAIFAHIRHASHLVACAGALEGPAHLVSASWHCALQPDLIGLHLAAQSGFVDLAIQGAADLLVILSEFEALHTDTAQIVNEHSPGAAKLRGISLRNYSVLVAAWV